MNNFLPLSCAKLTVLTLCAVVLQIVGLSLFVMGFFPIKPTLSGMSGLESFYPPGAEPTAFPQDISTMPPEKLKSLYQCLDDFTETSNFQEWMFIFPEFPCHVKVIDGLPAEFVIGKNGKPASKAFLEAMPYTQNLLARGLAIGYHAKAAPPTVTMPRLKSMVSGAIGGFLDVALNFNTQAFLDDNLIEQFFRIGWKMVMLGDETWLKLFPNMFIRHDGVSSFFVKDTIEVDHNVTRHLTEELSRADWDLLILHYLGLDHVGHIGGRNSVLMKPKLMEMDKVIAMIHSSITQTQEISKRTLLMIVSDHGMTEGGNHGGSSYEETDSLALFVGAQKPNGAVETDYEVFQVDVAATLSLLFGVPVPKNNVGTVIPKVFSSLKDDEHLRILELNSWQLMRLLKTHLSGLVCEGFSCDFRSGKNDDAKKFCCSYLEATSLHETWKSKRSLRSADEDDYSSIALAYHDFLSMTSKWLSNRATDKPTGLLAYGITAILLSCLGLMSLLFLLGQDVQTKESEWPCVDSMRTWRFHDYFIVAIIFILILSMGSSSMVEEEQNIWYFMTSSLYLILLRKIIQTSYEDSQHALNCVEERKIKRYSPMYYVFVVLVSGRILRGWHQGGVNWTYLPDISKFLEKAGTVHIKLVQLVSLVLVITVSFAAIIVKSRLKRRFAMVLMSVYLFPSLMIMNNILKDQDSMSTASNTGATRMIQRIYATLGIFSVGIFFVMPWLTPVQNHSNSGDASDLSTDASPEIQSKILSKGFKDSIYVIGWCYVFSWCLVQLLLQQPINSMPVLLLLVQILASIQCFSVGNPHLKEWTKVAALYYVGMTGHFGLGNTNTLATIDVAGAFMGISSYSTVISGTLMFIITYASPMLSLLSMLMAVSSKESVASVNNKGIDYGQMLKTSIGNHCLIPLCFNSLLLIAYTIVLLLMRNHLFVWSVFSPKYLYVCAATACVYAGVAIVALTATYSCIAFAARSKLRTYSRTRGCVHAKRTS